MGFGGAHCYLYVLRLSGNQLVIAYCGLAAGGDRSDKIMIVYLFLSQPSLSPSKSASTFIKLSSYATITLDIFLVNTYSSRN